MALKEKLMVKIQRGNTDLSLQARSGESLIIKDVLIYNPASNYVTLKTEKTSVGYFRVGGLLGSHLPLTIGSAGHSHGLTVAAADGALTEDHALSNAFGASNANLAITSDLSALTTVEDMVGFGVIPPYAYKSILRQLMDREIFTGFPVGDGETFVISGAAQSGSIQIVIYEKWETADFLPTMPNGSQAKEYIYVNYGRVAANVVTSVDTELTTTQNPIEFIDFPFGKTCPSKTVFTIFGILASDVVNDLSGNDTMNTLYLKLIRDRITLFDDDNNGLLVEGIVGNTDLLAVIARGRSLIGNNSDVDLRPALWLPEPIVFLAGDELNVLWTTIAGASQSASDLLIADLEVGLICKVVKE